RFLYMPAKKATPKKKQLSLVGTWFNADEYATEVEFIVTDSSDTLSVSVRDRQGDEEADIFETAYDGSVLSFAAHWNSTGRFARYKLMLLSANRISVTYTYTDNETITASANDGNAEHGSPADVLRGHAACFHHHLSTHQADVPPELSPS